MSIDDLNEEVGTALPVDGPRTLAGVVLEILGRKPEPGDEVQTAGMRLRVEALDGLRISSLRLDLPRQTDEAGITGEDVAAGEGSRREIQ